MTESKQAFAAKSPFQQTQSNGWVLGCFFFFFQLAEQREILIFDLLNHDSVVKLQNTCDERRSKKKCKGFSHHLGMSFQTQSASALIQTGRKNLGEQL